MNGHNLIHGHKPITPPKRVTVGDIDPYGIDAPTDPRPFFEALLAKGLFV